MVFCCNGVADNFYYVLSYNQVLATKLRTLNALLHLVFSKCMGQLLFLLFLFYHLGK